MNNILKCPACNSPLSLSVAFSGCDWDSEAGEGSGYTYPLSFDCTGCSRLYTVGYLTGYYSFSPVKDHKPYLA